MRIAVPREIKKHEYRVALTPAGVHELVGRGHDVFVQVISNADQLADQAPSSLLFRIATNVCLNRLRTRRRRPEDSDALLDELWAHVQRGPHLWTQEWRQGDLVIWDNRCTLHRRNRLDPSLPRLMHRTQVRDKARPAAFAA